MEFKIPRKTEISRGRDGTTWSSEQARAVLHRETIPPENCKFCTKPHKGFCRVMARGRDKEESEDSSDSSEESEPSQRSESSGDEEEEQGEKGDQDKVDPFKEFFSTQKRLDQKQTTLELQPSTTRSIRTENKVLN